MTDDTSSSNTTFTNEQIDALVSALPGCTSPHLRTLLPGVLEEWSKIDLNEHLTRAAPKEIRATRRRLERLASQADELAHAIGALDLTSRFTVASRLLQPDADPGTIGPSSRSAQRMDRTLENCPAKLQRLAAAAEQVAASWVPIPLREGTLKRYLVLLDLAAIYEWATGQRAGRWVHTDVSDDAGKTYGPFWDFARAVWPIVFGSEKGLDHAIKTWAKGRKDYDEWSPLMLNMDLRHPEWRIREP